MEKVERIEALLAPDRSADLGLRPDDELRSLRDEAREVETTVSYYRRLAQGRIEIMEAWSDHRASGGSVEQLVADLPRILAGDAVRASAPDSRFAEADPAIGELRWPDGRERLVADDSLANLPVLSDDEVRVQLATLRDFERELSETRRRLHRVIDAVEHELASRQAAGAAER